MIIEDYIQKVGPLSSIFRPKYISMMTPEMWICEVWRFVGMLYIKIDPRDMETHWNTSYYNIGPVICQGPTRPLKKGLKAPKGSPGAHKLCICGFLRILGMIYIKVDPGDRENHWKTSCNGICMMFPIIILAFQGLTRFLKRALGSPKGSLAGP